MALQPVDHREDGPVIKAYGRSPKLPLAQQTAVEPPGEIPGGIKVIQPLNHEPRSRQFGPQFRFRVPPMMPKIPPSPKMMPWVVEPKPGIRDPSQIYRIIPARTVSPPVEATIML